MVSNRPSSPSSHPGRRRSLWRRMTPEQQYEQFVCASGGDRCIRSILVANNGMAAAKFCMSIRNWLFERFGDSSLIRIVSMATAEDIKANAMHLHHADSFVEVPGGANFNNYANVSVIVRLALDNRVDAVWPGWGHASENPALPRALEKNGMVFIGPTDRAMFLLGDKIASTIIAESAGVPCVSWSGTGVRVQPDADGRVDVPEDKFAEACVNSAEEAVRVAERVGYPIMIKASEGGGGKGVRMATKAEQIAPMYQAVVDEVKGSPVFLMRLCTVRRARRAAPPAIAVRPDALPRARLPSPRPFLVRADEAPSPPPAASPC